MNDIESYTSANLSVPFFNNFEVWDLMGNKNERETGFLARIFQAITVFRFLKALGFFIIMKYIIRMIKKANIP